MKNPNNLIDKSEKARAYEIAAKIWKTLAVVIVILLLISALGYIIYDKDLSIYPLGLGIAILLLCFLWLFGKLMYLISSIYSEISDLRNGGEPEYFIFEELQDRY